MSYGYGMQPPQKQGLPVWVWILCGGAGLALVLMVVVLLFVGGDEPADDQRAQDNNAQPGTAQAADPGNANSSGEAPAYTGNDFFMRLVSAKRGSDSPYELVQTVPPNPRKQAPHFTSRPGTNELLLLSADPESGATQPNYEFWDATTRKVIRPFQVEARRPVFLESFSPDGAWLWFGTGDEIYVVDAETAATRSLYQTGSDEYLGFQADFTADSQTLVAAWEGSKLYGWDVRTGQQRFAYDMPDADKFEWLHLLPKTNQALYITDDETYRTINLADGTTDREFSVKGIDSIYSMINMPQGNGVVIDARNGTFSYDLVNRGKRDLKWTPFESPAFFMPGTNIVLVDGTAAIRMVDLTTGVDFASFVAHPEKVDRAGEMVAGSQATLTPDGEILVTVGANGTIKFWKLKE